MKGVRGVDSELPWTDSVHGWPQGWGWDREINCCLKIRSSYFSSLAGLGIDWVQPEATGRGGSSLMSLPSGILRGGKKIDNKRRKKWRRQHFSHQKRRGVFKNQLSVSVDLMKQTELLHWDIVSRLKLELRSKEGLLISFCCCDKYPLTQSNLREESVYFSV